MELDEMKQRWRQSTNETTKLNIEKMIQQKSSGPVAALKNVFRKQVMKMAVLPLVLILTNINNLHAVFTSILFWTYVAFCCATVAFAGYNYRIVKKMEVMTERVRANIEQQVTLLEKRKHIEVVGLRVMLLIFIALTEIVPYVQHFRTLDYWHSLPLALRMSAYATLLLAQYVINRKLSEQTVGRHLLYLKRLVQEMQE
jgi:F0F1-type ATP synthase membrane subunit a